MIRPSAGKGFLIFKRDLASGTIQKKTYQNFLEYWVYRSKIKKSRLIIPGYMQKKESYLYCIIVTKDDKAHLIEEEDRFYIVGVKMDNQEYVDESLIPINRPHNDLDKYLSKTGRK